MYRMKKIVLNLLLFLSFQFSFSQAHLQWLSDESRNIIVQGRECRDQQKDNCLDYFLKGFQQAKKDKKCIPCAELQLALHYNKISEFDSAYVHLKQLISSSEKLEPAQRNEIQLVAYNLKGVLEDQFGKVEESIKSYIKAADIADKLGKAEQAAAVKFNVGVIYFNQSNYKEANSIFREAYAKLKKLNS